MKKVAFSKSEYNVVAFIIIQHKNVIDFFLCIQITKRSN